MPKRRINNSKKALQDKNFDLFMAHSTHLPPVPKMALPIDIAVAKTDQLPSVETLRQLFDNFNLEYFGGILPEVKIAYSGRMLIAGSYSVNEKVIRIGRKYHEKFPEDIEDTLKHEMIHIIDLSHGRKFKAIARRIGASLRAKAHPELRLPAKYSYICPVCGKIYQRRKKLRMASCGTCSKGGKFDSSCKLKLLKKEELRAEFGDSETKRNG